MCLGSSDTSAQVVSILRCLICFVDEEKKSPIYQIFVISPPTPDGGEITELKDRLAALLKAIQHNASPAPPDDWIQMVTTVSLNTEALISFTDKAPTRAVIIVNEAARFRDQRAEAHVPGMTDHPTLPEDF